MSKHGGVGALASRVSARRRELNDDDQGELSELAESWGASFDLFGIDASDPVVGGTVMVAAKMLTHRVASLVEFGHEAEDLQPALYVTGEAALVGLSLLEKAKRRCAPPSRRHGCLAMLAGVALVISAVTAIGGEIRPPAAAASTPAHAVYAVTAPAGTFSGTVSGAAVETAWITVDPAAVEAYKSGLASSVPIVVHASQP